MQMRFICDNCHAKYSIAEQKVRNKVLKIRCKRCSHVIVVRDPEAQKELDIPVSAAPSSAIHPIFSSASLESLVPASSFQTRNEAPPSSASVTFASIDRVSTKPTTSAQLSSQQDAGEQRSERTMVARISADWFRQIREEKNEQPTWFYALHNAPVGPVTLSDLQTAIVRGEVHEQDLIWNAGWPNWRPASEASEVRSAFLRARGIAEPPAPSYPPTQGGFSSSSSTPFSSPHQTMDESLHQSNADTDRDLYDDGAESEGATSIQSIAQILQQGRDAGEDISDLSKQLDIAPHQSKRSVSAQQSQPAPSQQPQRSASAQSAQQSQPVPSQQPQRSASTQPAQQAQQSQPSSAQQPQRSASAQPQSSQSPAFAKAPLQAPFSPQPTAASTVHKEPSLAEPVPATVKPTPFSPLGTNTPSAKNDPFKPASVMEKNANASGSSALKGPSPLDWLGGKEEAPEMGTPLAARPLAESKPESLENPFSGLLGARTRPSAAPHGTLAAQTIPQQNEPPKAQMPFPAPVMERPAPPASKAQDVAMESQALPASMGDLIESSEEALFFDRSYKDSGTGNEIFEVELPPLPMSLDEPAAETELSIDDDDILEEMSETIKPRTGRNVLLVGAGVLVVLILLSSVVANRQINKMFEKREKAAELLLKPNQELTEEQKRLRDALLQGSGYKPSFAATPTKPRRRLVASARRSSSVRSTATPHLQTTKKQEMDSEVLKRLAQRGAMTFSSTSPQQQPSVRVADAAGVDQALVKKLLNEIEANKEKITYCYEQHLKALTISGRLVVMLGIEASGSVSSVEVLTPRFRGMSLTKCIVRSMRRWQFTPFTGESLKMEVPYLLKAQY